MGVPVLYYKQIIGEAFKRVMVKLSSKLLASFVILGLSGVSAGGWYFYSQSTQEVRESAVNQLMLVGEIKKHEVESVFDDAANDLSTLIKQMRIRHRASSELLVAKHVDKKAKIEAYMESLYKEVSLLQNNADIHLATRDFVNAHRTSGGVGNLFREQYYQSLSSIYGPRFVDIIETERWKNLLIINSDGYIVYSAIGNTAVGVNLRDDLFKSSSLKQAVEKLSTTDNDIDVSISDFASYSPIAGQQAAFMATRIVKNGKTIGYIGLQIGTSKLNQLVHHQDDKTHSFESYLYGIQDGKTEFRSNFVEAGIEQQSIGLPVTTEFINIANTSNQPVRNKFADHRNHLVLAAVDTLDIEGLQWGLVTQIRLEKSVIENGKFSANQDASSMLTLNENTYSELALLDAQGNVLISMNGESDFEYAVRDSKVRAENFTVNSGGEEKEGSDKRNAIVAFPPHEAAPAGFIVKPLYVKNKLEMLVVLGLPIERITSVMQNRDGVVEAIDTFLVRPIMRTHKTRRTESTNNAQSSQKLFSATSDATILDGINTQPARAAINGEMGATVSSNHKGMEVLSAYMPIEFGEITWALLIEMDKHHAY